MFNIEGIDLCKYGSIAFIQMATPEKFPKETLTLMKISFSFPDDKLYLIDIIKLGQKAFDIGNRWKF